MAAPANRNLPTLTGRYTTNTAHSTSPNALLSLQGISWLVRTAICAFPITLSVTCYTNPNDPKHILHIDIAQKAPGGIPGTTEKRKLDWEWSPHTDHIFGEVRGRARWITLPSGVSKMKDETDEDVKFLVEGFLPAPASIPVPQQRPQQQQSTGGNPGGKPAPVVVSKEALVQAAGKYLENHVESTTAGWTAHQVWGFENVEGKRHFVRHVVVRKGSQVERARLVYDWVGEL